ncbi:hypothetical protein JZO66_04105 [Enterococcus sp. DIV0242_7C1]|uniref:LXG domain-containing protein n=1 Tax=Candidatus Enterococcus dunnyi TaxID=1834192 RepID=A0A200JED1_9ENTE|nr:MULTISPECIES: hypothetical protein [unclassified Enterococcus]MBO0469718.1 hypothetical protein [Enterococcus sp. DIV0242_7C1]OUZ34995.1 hypothetical protein A5889_000470 [Enterococcus sp. 9D6_DIV0238]
MKPNLGYYVQNINDIVKETEEVGEKMNEYYEEVRKAIDEDKVTELAPERIVEIQRIFQDGTKEYETMLEKVSQLRPPARVMGIHKKFERSYIEYLAGCNEMILSLDPEKGIDVDLFNASEEKQDKATDDISFAITRMSNLLLKK